ncbi:hypothetical protein, conserved [Entamoeba dispar SAW760]|uniref:Leucine rich repeat containing protein BspA family protein n=1 Tax=Entamoeba dispar (strain ATCC PRA-260 / SAW760) TaxID=370354 RepID=B0EV81_ENTDS|nr:uncharacterized protein EDI_173310 [Entamoeba dispar SAW760]EDR21560.1 hypothetical protein, conserved [Entamoeba dispar SAW760]|eukprot:EDR21560.1 hypothetical protein, conserved [Entamoeba dispar SAW760]
MFHYNPIPLNNSTISLFPKIETLYLYNFTDTIYPNYKNYLFNYNMTSSKAIELKNSFPNSQFKHVEHNIFSYPIPDIVTDVKVTDKLFNYYGLSITLPLHFKQFSFNLTAKHSSFISLEFKMKTKPIIYSPVPIWFKGYLTDSGIKCPNIWLDKFSLNNYDDLSQTVSIYPLTFSSISYPPTLNFSTSLTSLEKCAFANCSSLTTLKIPSSILSIGDRCFYNCTQLKLISLSSSVISLGRLCFACCCSLSEVNIPHDIHSIYEGTFYNCVSLRNLNLPDSLRVIETNAFRQCTNLTILLPKSVKYFAPNAFEGCAEVLTQE